jgi:lambda family phage portal protein
MLSTFSEAELSRQIQSASYAAVIESELDYEKSMGLLGTVGGAGFENGITAATMGHLASVAPYYKQAGLSYNGSKVLHLVPGEKLNIVQGQVQGGQFEMFERSFLRLLSAGLNCSYEELSRDFSNVSYAAARQSMASIWMRYYRQRTMTTQKFAMPYVSAWLEEAIKGKHVPMLGRFKPNDQGWIAAKHALCRGDFVSWGKPVIDPVKEYTGKGLALSYGLTTLRDEVAAEGDDWQETLRQRKRETELRASLGLNPQGVDPTLAPGGAKGGPDGGKKSGNPQESRKARPDGQG